MDPRGPSSSGSEIGLPSLAGRDLSVRLISYSQNAEDVRLWRVLGNIEGGFYVDIGAHLPEAGSVTKLFYDAGWHGINVEPGPAFDTLAAARPRDTNRRTAVGEGSGTTTLWITHPHDGMSTTEPAAHTHVGAVIERFEPTTVELVRLEDLLAHHATGDIHFLKIDVEGAEAGVIRSNDWTRFRPWILVIEAVATLDSTPTHGVWEPMLLDAGYDLAAFDGLNRFYVARERAELGPALAYPVGVLDHYVTSVQYGIEVDRLRLIEERQALQHQLEALTDEVDRLRAQHRAVLASRTFRAGRFVAMIGRPILPLLDRLRSGRRG
jgi:FkbM family methyltransferase